MTILKKIYRVFPLIENALEREGIVFPSNDYGDHFRWHFGLGLWVRNTILVENGELYQEFVKNGVFHKDDQSQIVLILFYFYMREKSLEKS